MRGNLREKVRCVNKEGVVKFLTKYTIKNGGARRNGFVEAPLPGTAKDEKAKASDHLDMVVGDETKYMPVIPEEDNGIPTIETKPKGKPGRKPKVK